MSRRYLKVAFALLLTMTLALAGCAQPTEEPAEPTAAEGPEVRVASLLDSEGVVLGSMVIQMLEANGIKTVDKTKFGTPDVVRKALLAGDVDATIDYTGSGQYYRRERPRHHGGLREVRERRGQRETDRRSVLDGQSLGAQSV